MTLKAWASAAALLMLAACAKGGGSAADTYGATPNLPAPASGIPVIHFAKGTSWPADGAPHAPAGFTVTRFAEGLKHPRWLYLMPDGGVLVAEATTSPSKGNGVVGIIQNAVERSVGATGDSPERILRLQDKDGDGRAEAQNVFAEHLHQPFGMALVGDHFYVGNTDAVVRFPYAAGATSVSGTPETVLHIPYTPDDNGHWTRNLIANADGSKLYVSIGSSSNIADHGMAREEGRARIVEFNPDGSGARAFATGIRNPVGLAWEPQTHALWVATNERDMLGDNLVPDYITSVRDGAFYGWPFSYYGQHVDTRVKPQNPQLVASAIPPDFAMGAHTACLGLAFYTASAFPEHYRGGAFVAQHGSWNRSQRAGYKVVFVPFVNGRPAGQVEDFLTGFLDAKENAQGRPVGVIVDTKGALLVADDVGGIIWRIAPSA